ncbi:MAG: hypothetical protein QM765_27005 [Myxococcales bacterium]
MCSTKPVIRGVRWAPAPSSTFASFTSSTISMLVQPRSASSSGVSPSELLASTFAPRARSLAAFSACLASAAQWSGVPTDGPEAFGSPPSSSRVSMEERRLREREWSGVLRQVSPAERSAPWATSQRASSSGHWSKASAVCLA